MGLPEEFAKTPPLVLAKRKKAGVRYIKELSLGWIEMNLSFLGSFLQSS
jgi:hypothetical protein